MSFFPQKSIFSRKIAKIKIKIILSTLLYSSGTLAHRLLPHSVGEDVQMDNGGLGPLGALTGAPRGSKMPTWPKDLRNTLFSAL